MARPKIEGKEEYREYKMRLHTNMLAKQALPFKQKVMMSKLRIREFYDEAHRRGYNCHVSVGGLDSIVLGHLIRSC